MIGINTISKIKHRISECEYKRPDPEDLNHLYINFEWNTDPRMDSQKYDKDKIYKLCSKFRSTIFGETIQMLGYEEFIRINRIVSEPKLDELNNQNYKKFIIPYIIQKIKMWGCNALTPDRIKTLIKKVETEDYDMTNPFFDENDEIFSEASSTVENTGMPLSRLDIICWIFNSVEEVVAQDLLNNMAKFPQALPLIINDFRQDYSYKV
jgi:hypothetical protein